jgi:hypothetical protein
MSVEFVHIVDEVPGEAGSEPLPLLVGLHGFLDAGNASTLAVDHLVERASGPVVATFDVDAFHDYRARRPGISFVQDHFEDYDAPRLVVRLMRDSLEQHYVKLNRPERDTRWEGYTRAVRHVV